MDRWDRRKPLTQEQEAMFRGHPRLPAQRDLLVSWTPPREADQPFPNADRYTVDVQKILDGFKNAVKSTASGSS